MAEPAAPGLVTRGPFRYLRWDGRQSVPDLTADDILDAVTDDLLVESDLASALGRLLSRGVGDLAGLEELRERLARAREELLSRFQLGDILADVRRELDEVVATELHGIERRMANTNELAADIASRRQRQLQDLPADVAGRIRALEEYDFLEPEAREHFNEIVERLRRQVLDSYFAGMSDALKNISRDDLSRNRDMVRELNRLLQDRLEGREPDVDSFLARHGGAFPGAQTLDDIIEQLAARMSTMQSLLSSLTAEQRRELQETMDALLQDDRLRWDLAQLAATLDQVLPEGLGERFAFSGEERLSLEGALHQLGRLNELDALSTQLGEIDSPAALETLDADALGDLLDAESADQLRALQALARRLEEAGYAERKGDRLELTARGSRRVGQKVLEELFGRLYRDAFGGHRAALVGRGGERSEGSRPYEFGRPFEVDLQGTLAHALARPRRTESYLPLHIEPADFEVFETETAARAATVLLVDMSRSMLLRGCFLAAKKVAIALDTLIRSKYPRDELHVVGFAYYARPIRSDSLANLSWHGYEYGTNLQHGLALARGMLARSHAANREIVVITDGEPTAHFEAGQVEFSYPPTRRTLLETLREVSRVTRDGITINTFMLERSRALTEFVDRMTRINRGRAFYATPERLGEYVLVDYVSRRNRVI